MKRFYQSAVTGVLRSDATLMSDDTSYATEAKRLLSNVTSHLLVDGSSIEPKQFAYVDGRTPIIIACGEAADRIQPDDLSTVSVNVRDYPISFANRREEDPERGLPPMVDITLERGFKREDDDESILIWRLVLQADEQLHWIVVDQWVSNALLCLQFIREAYQ